MRDLGPLGHCLVEEEGATLRSAQRRRVSLLVSVTLQAAVLGALLLVPLLVNGERMQATLITPGIPPGGFRGTEPKLQNTSERRGPRGPRTFTKIVCILRVPEKTYPIGRPPLGGDGVPEVGPFVPGVPGGETSPMVPLLPGHRTYQPPSPPDPEPIKRIRLTSIDPGRILHRVQPVYPPLAKQARIEGEVKLRAIIGIDGAVREIVLLSGHALLIRSATDAVQQWRYQRTLLNGQPVEVETQITVVFILGR